MVEVRNIIELLSVDELQKLLDISTSYRDVTRKLGLPDSSVSDIRVGRRVKEEGLDLTKFNENKRKNLYLANKKKELKDILVENSTYSRDKLKKRLLKEGLLKNRCYICNLDGLWNGKPINMVLDHINGINNDNRLENLRMVCYNCNSQLDTFAGRNVKRNT